jgi:outer membrane protein TolC
MVEASQKLPWPGKRCLRGQQAQAEADVAGSDVSDARLRLSEAAQMAFYDFYLVRREMEVNQTSTRLMHEFRDIAKTKYESNEVSQQDLLQADVELGDLETRQAELQREEKIAQARINTLLHRAADDSLPPPPARLQVSPQNFDPATLQSLAVAQRPDLAGEAARIRAEEAAVELACKDFYPDVTVVAKYDAFMPEEMRSQLGMNLEVPIQRTRRCAALREATARLQQRRAEYQDRCDQIAFEVQSAYVRLEESQRVARLYREKLLPLAEQNSQSARANYVAGKIDFLRLIEAQRQSIREQEQAFQAIAEYHRRLAELERAVGGALPATL